MIHQTYTTKALNQVQRYQVISLWKLDYEKVGAFPGRKPTRNLSSGKYSRQDSSLSSRSLKDSLRLFRSNEPRIRGGIPNVANSRDFEKGMKCVMNKDLARAVEKHWDKKPFRLRIIKSDSDGIFRTLGYAILERAIFQITEIDEVLEV